ncbi:MAG: hypothetical protein ACX93I_07840 [Winogradskyella sp.]
MNIVEELTYILKGKYFSEDLRSVTTPGGTFISQNSYGIIRNKGYIIKIYSYNNMGVRVANTYDGSPFKIVLILPLKMKKSLSIYPKSSLKKLVGYAIGNSSINGNNIILKNYSLKGNRKIIDLILKDPFLVKEIPMHKIYISSKIGEESSYFSLRPNESATTVNELKKLYDIMDRLGIIISGGR